MQLDEEILAQLRRVGGEKLVQELIRLYLTHTPERMRRARKALGRNDLAAAAKAIHSLRSASATLGAGELASALGEVEGAANGGDAASVTRGWREVEKSVEDLLESLSGQPVES